MSEKQPAPGAFVWRDLTVPNATEVRDFYSKVVGWKAEALSMGEYDDYVMTSSDGEVTGGICHARGSNSKQPPFWMLYITVESVEASAQLCLELGGKVIDGPRLAGKKPFCVIQDPGGAYVGLIEG